MPVHRVIFRADLGSANYEILDNPGSVLRILQGAGESFFKQVQDAAVNRTIVGSTGQVGDSESYRMSVSPLAIDFSYETAAGIDFQKFEAAETLRALFKYTQELTEHFKIRQLQRAGLRLYYLGSVGKGTSELVPVFRKATHSAFVDAIGESIGSPADYGFHFDGEKEALKYHLHFGPYRSQEAARYFETVHSKLDTIGKGNIVCDLDQYEESFVQTVTWSVWTRTAVTRAVDFVSRLERSLNEQINVD
ncbi:hypothetical protein F6X40_20945 [Paraburkholderia sp. UCT31]|uniref:hypothetical protein n=1 Tax=Paraburkholderia sp. UCT31 TaxID=2615209 RepID=UPI0016552F1C|nr:hypothetical protein [Paraburkholderia sp. UCT31]MBC8739220.1 hypothetical protein [Paraburkholderia sp. UCT31]